jgi:hypothetical protein
MSPCGSLGALFEGRSIEVRLPKTRRANPTSFRMRRHRAFASTYRGPMGGQHSPSARAATSGGHRADYGSRAGRCRTARLAPAELSFFRVCPQTPSAPHFCRLTRKEAFLKALARASRSLPRRWIRFPYKGGLVSQ